MARRKTWAELPASEQREIVERIRVLRLDIEIELALNPTNSGRHKQKVLIENFSAALAVLRAAGKSKKRTKCKPWCGVYRVLPTSETWGRTFCTKKCRSIAERAGDGKEQG